ncbi:bifunctional PPM-type phosphatase [Babesia duncani]|uniref:Bifunctional PPM-type phosphatase n=1 Tax=Babesia duncani TaxID=323732 RepID=A0AAD9UQC2_9APIC|nr:bifunctional PPM-type phosphatase [Babesia duncani]
MGAHLSSPRKEKISSFGGSDANSTIFGSSSIQGWRISMEDAHLTVPELSLGNLKIALYGVFDGHGGASVSNWTAENFASLLGNEYNQVIEDTDSGKLALRSLDRVDKIEAILAESLQSTFFKIDEELAKPEVDAVLHSIADRLRTESGDMAAAADANLLKVLLPDKLSNRMHVQNLVNSLHQLNSLNNVANGLAALDENTISRSAAPEAGQNMDGRTGAGAAKPSSRNSIGHHSEQAGQSGSNAVPSKDTSDSVDDGLGEGGPFGGVACDLEVSEEQAALEAGLDEALVNITAEDFDEDDAGMAYGCGAASVVVAIVDGPNPCLLVANAGDSRAVLCRGGRAIALTHDHKPQLQEESDRIRRAGGCVTNGRVDGNLNLSRALGDLSFKRDTTLSPAEQRITALPDVRICPLNNADEFVVLACDGIWDCKTNQQVVDFVRRHLCNNEPTPEHLSRICENLCDECLSVNPNESEGVGCDNMTVVIVHLNRHLVAKRPIDESLKIVLYGKESDEYLFNY